MTRIMAYFFFISMLVFPWLGAISARGQSAYGGFFAGVIVGAAMTLIAGPEIGVLVVTALCPVGFAMDRIITGHYSHSRQRNVKPAWWAGGRWL